MTSTADPTSPLASLFSGATSAGVISPDTQSMLSGDIGQVVVAGAAGKPLEELVATDVTLVTAIIDASSSIAASRLESAVREGQHAMLDAFAGSKAADGILVATWTFNDQVRVVHSYVPVGQAARLDRKSYRAGGCTALYDAWCDALAANVAYAQQLRDGGTPVRSVALVITDGEDTASRRRPAACRRLTTDLLASEQFVLGFVGVGREAQFRSVARSMGLPAGSILIQRQATPAALRATFRLVSQSAIRASQGLIRPGPNAGFFTP